MPSYTTSLRLIQPATGEYSGTWGTQVNNGITALVDAAVAGTASITMTAANYTLSNNNGASDEARAMFLVLQGTPGASYFVIVPAVSKLYFVTNNTGFAQRISTSTTPGSGISVPNGASMTLRCDGTNVVQALTTFGNLTYTGTLTGSTGILDIGSGQIYKDGSGNVGIGTSSPAGKVDSVSNATAAYAARASTAGANQIADVLTTFNSDASLYALARYNAVQHIWRYAGTTEGMRLDSSGNLGLGVTPSAWLGAGYIDFPGNGYVGNAASYSGNTLSTGLNAYYGTGNWRYKQSSLEASRFDHTNGAFAWYTAPPGTAGNTISFTQAMTLDASGDLLVGTTATGAAGIGISNGANLTFTEGSGASYVNLFRQSNSAATVLANGYKYTSTANGFASSVGSLWAKSAITLDGGDVIFYANGATTVANGTDVTPTERARITSGGDLLVGTTDAAATATTNGLVCSGTNPGFVISRRSTGAAQTHLEFRNGGANVGNISSSTTTTTYATTSDRRLKDNIVPAPSASNVIDAIQIVSHDWKSAPDEHVTFGVIAQDLALVAPQAVLQGDDGDEIEKTWGVDYSKLVPMLIKEIQSLRARVAALEAA